MEIMFLEFKSFGVEAAILYLCVFNTVFKTSYATWLLIPRVVT